MLVYQRVYPHEYVRFNHIQPPSFMVKKSQQKSAHSAASVYSVMAPSWLEEIAGDWNDTNGNHYEVCGAMLVAS